MPAPLAILPGLLCDSRMFGAMVERFDGAVAVDGFYAGCASIEAMADYALARLPERVTLFGHSMGARVALELCREAPERVERLILADTGVHPVSEGEAEKRHALLQLGERDGAGALVDRWLPPMVWDGKRDDAQLMKSLRAMCIDAGVETYRRQITALLARPSTEEALASIACETLILVGEHDQWSPPDQHEEFASQIAGAELKVIGAAGHMAPAENPSEFCQAIAEWLAAKA